MSILEILVVIVLVLSVSITFWASKRVLHYNQRYHLPETKYTKLFGFITNKHILSAYILFALTHAIMTLIFLITIQ